MFIRTSLKLLTLNICCVLELIIEYYNTEQCIFNMGCYHLYLLKRICNIFYTFFNADQTYLLLSITLTQSSPCTQHTKQYNFYLT